MILEEIDGDVVVTIMKSSGEKAVLAIGDYISDHESSTICVTGVGKATVRVDPSCTFDVKGAVEAEVVETFTAPVAEPVAPAPVEAAPVAEVVVPAVEAPVEVAKEPAKK